MSGTATAAGLEPVTLASALVESASMLRSAVEAAPAGGQKRQAWRAERRDAGPTRPIANYSLRWWIAAEDGAQIHAGLAGRLCPQIALADTTEDQATGRSAGTSCRSGFIAAV